MNTRWLAARCAAATGQPCFRDLVWTALKGHPQGSSDCFEGISSTFILRALGEEFSTELLSVPEDNFRFDALAIIGRTPTAESLRLAEVLAIKDPAPIVRRLAFRQLFLSGRRGWIRRFFRDAKDQCCPQGSLRVLQAFRRCTLSRFRKFAGHCLDMQTTTEQRIKTLAFWSQVDPTGACSAARKEYDLLVQVDPSLSQESEWRLFCLRTGGEDVKDWAAPRFAREALASNKSATIDFQLLRELPDQECGALVEQLLPELVKEGPTAVIVSQQVADLAPLTAASLLLRKIVGSDDEEERQRLRRVLHGINHGAVVRAAMHDDFENLNPAKLRALLRAVNVGFPGGNPNTLQQLSNEELTSYRQHLLHWLSLLPQLDQDSAFEWANCATLIGEVKNPDDADLLYGLLQADQARASEQVELRKREIEAWEATGRSTVRPGPIVQTSYGNWHIAALANIPGNRCSQIMIELLSHPSHIGICRSLPSQQRTRTRDRFIRQFL